MFKKILIYNSGGGLGDSIQLFPLISSLKNTFNNIDIFYLGAHNNHFDNKLKEYNIKIKDIELGLKYFGFRWWHLLKIRRIIKEKKIPEFDLIIDLQSKIRNTIILKQIPCRYFYSSTYNYFFCTKDVTGTKFNGHSNAHKGIQSIIFNLTYFLNNKFKVIEYSKQNISKKYYDEAKKLLPESNYIGLSVTQGNEYRKKSWLLSNFIDLAKKYISEGKRIVFFIEKSEVDLIDHIKTKLPDSLFPEHKSEIACPALVTTLASRLEGAVTIDNGVMHMIGLAKIPMIILFGPTNSKKFTPLGSSIEIIDSKEIYKSENINKITVQDVLKKNNF
jgi:ADP-heptose:LPS heptosyltransferase|tara:strand:+ start:405 stop:1400 length:996 start_codon:yes stop_codon:yes gene_type:complete